MSGILILGGGGFLAGYIARHYRSLGWRVISVGRGVTSADGDAHHACELPHTDFAHLLAREQPDLCVNAAGRASVQASMVEPLADFEASVLLNFRLLEDLRRRSPQTVYIHLSSAAVYGNPTHLPVREDASFAPISPYGWHKRLTELVVEEHSRQYHMRAASLRIFSTYGVGLRRQVVWDLASRAAAAPDKPLVLQGPLDDTRDFLHASDVARAVQIVAEHGALQGECYNTASGIETSMGELATLILDSLGRPVQIETEVKRRPGNPARWHADISKLKALSFIPTTTLYDGVREIVRSISRQHD